MVSMAFYKIMNVHCSTAKTQIVLASQNHFFSAADTMLLSQLFKLNCSAKEVLKSDSASTPCTAT
jgi:hypothetical protein